MTAGTHVVFGTGPAGRAVAEALISQGARVRTGNRSGSAPTAGVETTGGDATNPEVPGRVELLDARRRGEIRVVIGRASDFVGPGVRDSAMGEFAFGPALAGERAQSIGRPDTQHTCSHAPDLGRNLVLLGSRDDANSRAWHLPNPETRTTRHIIIDVYAASGVRRTRVTALNRPRLRALGLFKRNVRELLHTYYQFDAPFVVDDSALRDAFGGHTTEWADVIARTVDWYHVHPTAPELRAGLLPATSRRRTQLSARRPRSDGSSKGRGHSLSPG